MEADKYAIMKKVFIPARDLRILDPNLSYPSTILGREQAIVVNLEQIKVIEFLHCMKVLKIALNTLCFVFSVSLLQVKY